MQFAMDNKDLQAKIAVEIKMPHATKVTWGKKRKTKTALL